MPDWKFSELNDDSLWYAVESPLITDKGSGVALMTMDVSHYVDERGDKSLARQVLRLIVLRNKEDGKTYSFMMAVLPNFDYMLEKREAIEENKYLARQSDFSGLVYFYSVDGQFINGWMYQDGMIIGSTNEEDANGTKRAVIVETEYCWIQDVYAAGKYLGRDFHCEITYQTVFIREPIGGGGGRDTNLGGVNLPGGGGGGGNNGYLPYDEVKPKVESEDPCANLKNKMSDITFRRMLQDLGSITNKDYEGGKAYRYQDGKYNFTTHNGSPGEPDIKYVPLNVNRIDGFIHSHYDGILKTFSPSDLVMPYNWFVNNGINDLNTFTLGLVTSGGTYFIFVTDLQKYMKFGGKYGHGEGQDLLSFFYSENGLTENINDENSTNILIGLLDKLDSGLTLMKDTGSGKYGVATKDRKGNIEIIDCK